MVRRLAGSEHQGQPDPPPYPHPPNLAEEESRNTYAPCLARSRKLMEINGGQIPILLHSSPMVQTLL